MTRAEQLRKHKNVMRSQFAVGPRFCTQCLCQRPRAGGREITYNGGKNQRWVCAMHGDGPVSNASWAIKSGGGDA